MLPAYIRSDAEAPMHAACAMRSYRSHTATHFNRSGLSSFEAWLDDYCMCIHPAISVFGSC